MKTFSKIEELLTEAERSRELQVKFANDTAAFMTQTRIQLYIYKRLNEYPRIWIENVAYIMSLRKP